VSNPFRLLTFLLTLAIVLSALPSKSVRQVQAVSGTPNIRPAVQPVIPPVTSVDLSTYIKRAGSTCPNLHALLRASTTIMKVNLLDEGIDR